MAGLNDMMAMRVRLSSLVSHGISVFVEYHLDWPVIDDVIESAEVRAVITTGG